MHLTECLTIDFGADDPALAGWSAPEGGRRWAKGWRSALTLPRPRTADELVLILTLDPFVFPPVLNRQTFRIKVNGTTIRQTYLAYRTVLACRIDPALLTGHDLELVFEHPDMVRPAMVSASTDQRDYSVAFLNLALLTAARPAPARLPPPVMADVDLPPLGGLTSAALVGHFASIGNNCEFGLMQRRYGAEPMDMLRFAGVSFDGLMRGIATGFEDIDNCNEVEYQIREGGGVREYVLDIKRFDLQTHTGVHEGEMPAHRLIGREVKKFRLLRRLFLADLASGNRIFVYKRNELTASSDLSPLAAMLHRHGPVTLLVVVLADTAHPPGTVERVGDKFLRGYLDRFNPLDNAAMVSSDSWLDICRNAYALWREDRLAAAIRPEMAPA